ncbi:MAG: TauD/TfdA family dioxygenase [Pirellulaceae bacterium]|nr:TauD/TfdA family dioxygenase [Fuerstiella sp.]HIK94187.1 TauD/TfdA family dioxygenase [Planctomycetota bacterium]
MHTNQPQTASHSNVVRYDGPAAWTAPEMHSSDDWVVRLNARDIAELASAVTASRDIPLVSLSRGNIKLPTLGQKLCDVQREVVERRGFVLIRGLPVAEFDRETIARMYYGMATWLGDAVPQNAAGHLLGHVKDIGQDPHNPVHRVYATNYRHLFHTDSCDIVGLLCLHPAKSGGLSAIASSTSLYNQLACTRPDLADVLAQPFHVDRKGEIPAGKEPTYEMAVFHHGTNYLTTVYARDFIEAAQRFDNIPRLSQLQIEAMDMLDDLAASDEFRLDMDFQPGDIQFLHNHQILHARTGYEDYPDPKRKRHLLRLWLSAPTGRKLPAVFAERYGEVDVGKIRGGVRVPGQTLQAPLDAEWLEGATAA